MIITKYDPFNEFKRSIDLFNSIVNSQGAEVGSESELAFIPTVNSREEEDAYYLEIDLPGVKKEDIVVNIEDGILTISGERRTKKEEEGDNYYKIESSYGKFSRSFTLPKTIDESKIEAESKDGVLELTIPKVPDVVKTKKIDIK